jgi:hypothetical protein
MRFSEQSWDDVRLYLEIMEEGVGLAGLSPTVSLRRTSNGDYLQADNSWGAGEVALAMTDVGGGLYTRQVSSAALNTTDRYYVAEYNELTQPVKEHELVTTKISGDDQRRMFAARLENVRFIPATWDPTTKQPMTGTIYLYPSAAAYDADAVPDGTGAMASYPMEADFSAGQLQFYGSKKGT